MSPYNVFVLAYCATVTDSEVTGFADPMTDEIATAALLGVTRGRDDMEAKSFKPLSPKAFTALHKSLFA